MRILYIAKFGEHDNCDEEAIAHALKLLGHEVIYMPEQYACAGDVEADFCLIHKWGNVEEIKNLSKKMPMVFWYFDMVRPVDGDYTLLRRSEERVRWMNEVIPHCLVGFLTDGDWVIDYNYRSSEEKLVHLLQGADERFLGMGSPVVENVPPILFTGMRNHGRRRAEHIDSLQRQYASQFLLFGDAGPRHRVHGRQLADLFASTRIVVAPDGPSTHNYWSNRVYLTLGLGGFLLHPYCRGLTQHYRPGSELIYYHDREDLNHLIDRYLEDHVAREEMRIKGLEATRERNLYRHRCEALIREVQRSL